MRAANHLNRKQTTRNDNIHMTTLSKISTDSKIETVDGSVDKVLCLISELKLIMEETEEQIRG